MSIIPSSSSFLQVADTLPSQQQQQGGGGGGNSYNKVRVVAGYALQQKLGSGSFAVVYKGIRLPQQQQQQQQQNMGGETDNNDNQNNDDLDDAPPIVAIKAIARTSEKLTKKVLLNLEMEINILRTYRHRNIVCMHDVQKTERHFYLLLEYCGGGDVQHLIRSRRNGRLSEILTRRLMRDLSCGLKFLWGQELIHRDIKPQNLLLTGPLPCDEIHDPEKTNELEQQRIQVNYPSCSFCLKIADFGFARHLQSASLAETLCGSPLYMAPEILQHQRYDAKADLWSVGTVLYEMITGKPPFNGENHYDLLRNIQKKAVRLPQNVRVSKECVNLLRLLLNRQPLTRAGFKEFFEACDALVALGCSGTWSADRGNIRAPPHRTTSTASTATDLGTIPENQDGSSETPPPLQEQQQEQQRFNNNNNHTEDSLLTVATHASITQQQQQQQQRQYQQQQQGQPQTIFTRPVHPLSSSPSMVTPPFGPIPSPAYTSGLPVVVGGSSSIPPQQQQQQQQGGALTRVPPGSNNNVNSNMYHHHSQYHHSLGQQQQQYNNIVLQPLVPSPPTSSAYSPIYAAHGTLIPPMNLDTVSAAARHAAGSHYIKVGGGGGGGGGLPQQQQQQQIGTDSPSGPGGSRGRSDLQLSSEENSFVMVDPPPLHKSPPGSGNVASPATSEYYTGPRSQYLQPTSPSYYLAKSPVTRNSGINDYMMVKPQQKGMLSTSPGTGGALMGMLGGRARLLYAGHQQQQQQPPQQQPQASESGKQAFEIQMLRLTKMLAASEDVGRRAISVAHLGDNRAYVAMRLVIMNENIASSLLSVTPMEGIVEEETGGGEHDSGTVTDDSSCTEIMASVQRRPRRRSSSATDKSMSDVKEDEVEEMPFALDTDSGPVVPAGMPSRTSSSFGGGGKGASITQGQRQMTVKPTPALIRSHFSEALSCYLKALKMLKGSVGAAQRVVKELEESIKSNSQRISNDQQQEQDQRQQLEKLLKRCEVTSHWLGGQFHGVLERADAANGEISKIPVAAAVATTTPQYALTTTTTASNSPTDRPIESVVPTSVEELIYNHSLAHGREGAVKHLLGQYGAARASYRSAGLLAETLLMEPSLGHEDRKILEDYVDGFAERITELDVMLQQQQQQQQQEQQHQNIMGSRLVASTSASRRSMMPAVVSLIGQPAFAAPTGSSPTLHSPRFS